MNVRHYGENDSIFLDGQYLIKGVAGSILWVLLRDHLDSGRTAFSNRELRVDRVSVCPTSATTSRRG